VVGEKQRKLIKNKEGGELFDTWKTVGVIIVQDDDDEDDNDK